jgi:hypothetical protein
MLLRHGGDMDEIDLVVCVSQIRKIVSLKTFAYNKCLLAILCAVNVRSRTEDV